MIPGMAGLFGISGTGLGRKQVGMSRSGHEPALDSRAAPEGGQAAAPRPEPTKAMSSGPKGMEQ